MERLRHLAGAEQSPRANPKLLFTALASRHARPRACSNYLAPLGPLLPSGFLFLLRLFLPNARIRSVSYRAHLHGSELQSLAMSHTHDIDNDDDFFLLDPYESLTGSRRLKERMREPQHPHSNSHNSPPLPSSSAPVLPLDWYYDPLPVHNDMADDASSSPSKGKGVSQPLYIQGREPADILVDTSQIVGSSSSAGNLSPTLSWPDPSPSIVNPSPIQLANYHNLALNLNIAADLYDLENAGESSACSAKGKGRERPPVLPPLELMSPSLDYIDAQWASSMSSISMSPQTAGPSSYGSGFASIVESARGATHDVTPPVSPEVSTPLEPVPNRRRSLSNVSIRSTRSLSALPINRVKAKLATSKGPGHIARKLLFKRRQNTPTPSPSSATTPAQINHDLHGNSNCFLPWARDLKSCTSPPQGTLVDIDVDLFSSIPPASPLYRLGPASGSAVLRTKGRSYSSPFPLASSPLDIVPITPTELSRPILVNVPNYFDDHLPRELRILVLAALVHLHEAEHRQTVASGKWTAFRAGLSRNRHVGAEKGIRELLKLSRVGILPLSPVKHG